MNKAKAGDKLNNHHDGSEYREECRQCGGKVEMIQEGTIFNPQPDITKCPCSTIEHENSLEFMGQTLHYGNNRIL